MKLSPLQRGLLGLVALSTLLAGHLAVGQDQSFDLSEISQHNSAESCWVVVEKRVYDLTRYLPQHNRYGVSLLEFCGQDATEAWNTKGEANRPHSRRAQAVLRQHLKGPLSSPPAKLDP